MIERIVQTMMKIQVQWALEEVTAILQTQGLPLVQSAGKRRTFQDKGQQKYSFYFRGDGHIDFVEATFDVRFDTELLSNVEYDRLISEWIRRYDDAIVRVTALLGLGKNFSPASVPDMPHQRDAIRLTMWNLPGADLMLELKHEGREVPIRLVLTLAPKAE